MPNNETAKTASAPRPRKLRLWSGALWFALFIVCTLSATTLAKHQANSQQTLHVGGQTYTLQVASDAAARARGLGGLASLPANQGMLFTFSSQATECFWMKGMHFPLDMIWLNGTKHVVHIEQHVSPSSYPHSFCSPAPALYLIELNAGQAARAHITTGQALSF